jgi:hypothetical protein
MSRIYALWNPGPTLRLDPAQTFQELEFGEDVEGLVDLPIQEMIRGVRGIFPQAGEQAGSVAGPGALGRVQITWTWQWLRIAAADLTAEELAQIQRLARQYQCQVFDSDAASWQLPS